MSVYVSVICEALIETYRKYLLLKIINLLVHQWYLRMPYAPLTKINADITIVTLEVVGKRGYKYVLYLVKKGWRTTL